MSDNPAVEEIINEDVGKAGDKKLPHVKIVGIDAIPEKSFSEAKAEDSNENQRTESKSSQMAFDKDAIASQ